MTESREQTALPQPKPEQTGYAVIGLGKLTLEELLPAFAVGRASRLAAVVSGDPAEARAAALAYGLTEADAYSYDDFEKLGERDDVHAVYIVLPNSLHREYTERAAKIGKHVLCEKPLATSVEDAEAMVRACKDAGVFLMTAYRCQYTPHHWAARDAVQSGRLGQIKLMHSVNVQVEPNEGQWRLRRELAGGGSLPDVGLYCVNTVRFLLGEEPYEVSGTLYSTPGDERFREVEESVTWQMRFPSGVVAQCACSYGAATARSIDVFGTEGRLAIDPAFDYQNLRLTVQTGQDVTEVRVPPEDQFRLETDHFSRRIQEGCAPYTPGEEGLQDQKIMAAIYQSAHEGGRPVALERFEGRDVFRGAAPERS
ncbi:Gfo/Idh/MocA family protein [Deinococcus sp. Leaf326]|uniref:Gfo/Idh/MocA family protein n=1 Tax=Deinococcus sp. Leaf326 TaxID=1736338 RepID=UPI000700BB35|nr:Gfo/Idh/MocA family oxidoreductase [Deinococcus sp. Leaf326]KQR22980.1 oxidoreductase [Deinococcus sp. Leaf326]